MQLINQFILLALLIKVNEVFQFLLESLVIGGLPLTGARYMFFGLPGFLVYIALHEQSFNIFAGVDITHWMDGIGLFPQNHGCQTIVLRHYNISRTGMIDNNQISCLGSPIHNQHGCIFAIDLMMIVRNHYHCQVMLLSSLFNDLFYRTGICVDNDFQNILLMAIN